MRPRKLGKSASPALRAVKKAPTHVLRVACLYALLLSAERVGSQSIYQVPEAMQGLAWMGFGGTTALAVTMLMKALDRRAYRAVSRWLVGAKGSPKNSKTELAALAVGVASAFISLMKTPGMG